MQFILSHHAKVSMGNRPVRDTFDPVIAKKQMEKITSNMSNFKRQSKKLLSTTLLMVAIFVKRITGGVVTRQGDPE